MSRRALAGLAGAPQWWGLALLGLPGGAVASYLTYAHWRDSATVCGLGDCELVQTSEYSAVAGVPVALLGLLYFLAISLLALARIRWPASAQWAQPVALAMALVAAAFASYLTYVELFVLEAICVWCASLAGLAAAALALTVWGALAGEGR